MHMENTGWLTDWQVAEITSLSSQEAPEISLHLRTPNPVTEFRCETAPALMWVLGIWTQVVRLAQQALCCLGISPSSSTLPFCVLCVMDHSVTVYNFGTVSYNPSIIGWSLKNSASLFVIELWHLPPKGLLIKIRWSRGIKTKHLALWQQPREKEKQK